MLVEYVLNKKGQRIGVVVATGQNQIGWSRCNKKDRFDRIRGLEIATGRALTGSNLAPTRDLWATIEKMGNRANRYFKH